MKKIIIKIIFLFGSVSVFSSGAKKSYIKLLAEKIRYPYDNYGYGSEKDPRTIRIRVWCIDGFKFIEYKKDNSKSCTIFFK